MIPTLLAVGLGFGLQQTATYAQSNSSVSVSGKGSQMDPVIVTATRTPTLANDVLADYVYIGPEEIAEAGQSTITQLLQRQRGVEVSASGGGVQTVFLRGSNSNQTLVMIDGVRTTSVLSGGASWSAIPVQLIDHIEIIFGPQSSLYGSDAIGGVINIFTKKGVGPTQVTASTGFGTYGTSISQASLFGSTQGDQSISYSVSATAEHSAGYNTIASNNPYKSNYNTTNTIGNTKTGGAAQVSQEWAKGQSVGAQVYASRNNNQYPVYGPGKVLGNQINEVTTLALYSKNQITDIWNSNLQVAQSYDSGQAIYPSQNPAAWYPAGNPLTNTKQNIYTWQNDINVGPDLVQILAERRTVSMYATGANTLNLDQDTNSVGAAYQLKRGANLANFSLRNDNITGYGSQNTGGASYGYFFTKELRVNVNYGTGFKAPSFYDLYYPNYGVATLKPEKSQNTEAGIHYETLPYDIHLVVYNNTITNLIQYTSLGCPVGYSTGCASNVASAKISGASLGGVSRIGSFTLKGSFDQQNPVDQSTGYVLAKRAKQFGNVSVEYKKNAMLAGVEGTFQAQRNDYGNTGTMNGYGIANIYGSYDFDRDWSLFARWNNIFNKNYQLNYGYIPPGSNVFVGIRYAMK
ncbi:TonB-dependent receptor [Polynucleobacter sp.]|uniref:TonB-dependent receptor domain-containing protein n=1 Tax=Polynucleobacter sp. TaxID=2029855 RepID=UPI00261D00AD|nr:TonB-dependent receptor [Polynucleobacter sp.]MCW1965135.1 TonB-dependent receptor [Polynucleobacter sp.]